MHNLSDKLCNCSIILSLKYTMSRTDTSNHTKSRRLFQKTRISVTWFETHVVVDM